MQRRHTDHSKKSMGKDFDRVVKVLLDVEKERDDFRLKLTE